jgi:hypothetical protein
MQGHGAPTLLWMECGACSGAALPLVIRQPPEIVLIGAEIGAIRAFDDRLSAPVGAAVAPAIRLVLDETCQTSSSVTASWPTSRNSV